MEIKIREIFKNSVKHIVNSYREVNSLIENYCKENNTSIIGTEEISDCTWYFFENGTEIKVIE